MTRFFPETQTAAAEILASNAAGSRQHVRIRGGKSAVCHDSLNGSENGHVEIYTGGLDRVVDYPARDLTITVETGQVWSALVAALAAQGQQLPIDVAEPDVTTVGAALATSAYGPRAHGLGSLRDYVIGMSAIDATGRLFKSGGRVVKNVAGYDLGKLLVGSRGTLAMISQVTFKLRPAPLETGAVWATFRTPGEAEHALSRLLLSDARPVSIDFVGASGCDAGLPTAATAGQSLAVVVGVQGTAAEVEWQRDRLSREMAAVFCQGVGVWDRVVTTGYWQNFVDEVATNGEGCYWKAVVRPSELSAFCEVSMGAGFAVWAHAGSGVVYGRGAVDLATVAERLAEDVKRSRGVFLMGSELQKGRARGGEDRSAISAKEQLRERVRAVFDPHSLLTG